MTPEVWRARRRPYWMDAACIAGFAFVAFVVMFFCGYAAGRHDGRQAAQREHVEHRDFAPASGSSLTWSGAEQVAPLATLTVGDDLSARGADCNVEIRDGRGNLIGTTLAACSPWSGTWTIANFTPAGTR